MLERYMRIKDAVNASGISFTSVLKRAGVNWSTVGRWESGSNAPSRDKVLAIETAAIDQLSAVNAVNAKGEIVDALKIILREPIKEAAEAIQIGTEAVKAARSRLSDLNTTLERAESSVVQTKKEK